MADLTKLEQAFVDNYNGNSVEAVKKAGYIGDSEAAFRAIARANLDNPFIRELIEEKQAFEKEMLDARIFAEREQRRSFWNRVMNGDQFDMKDRIKCSELLGKADGDFIDRSEISGPGGRPIQAQQVIFKWQ